MWPDDFPSRLQEWVDLRTQCADLDQESALHAINNWWFQAPLILNYLHPADVDNWPDPWELLADNYFCDLARGLGIVYTIQMIEILQDCHIEMIITDQDYLIQIDQSKYTLNYAPGSIVNITPQGRINYAIDGEQVKQKINNIEV